jgi:hypothetical protein
VRKIASLHIPSSSCEFSVPNQEPHYKDFFDRIPSTNTKKATVDSRADIAITSKGEGNALPATLIDITICHPTSYLTCQNFEKPGAASEMHCQTKLAEVAKSWNIADTKKGIISMVGMDTTGAMSASAVNFCRFLTQSSPDKPEYAPRLGFIKQALSVSMMYIITSRHDEVMSKYSVPFM